MNYDEWLLSGPGGPEDYDEEDDGCALGEEYFDSFEDEEDDDYGMIDYDEEDEDL